MNTLMSQYWEKRDKAKGEKGFTLIELMIVVAIVAAGVVFCLRFRAGLSLPATVFLLLLAVTPLAGQILHWHHCRRRLARSDEDSEIGTRKIAPWEF